MRLAILLAHGYTSEKNTGTKPTMFASPKRPKLIVATPALKRSAMLWQCEHDPHYR
jgi:hypothetical protein